ncbi:hypothetical protein [Burkholderia stagnalis]|uniref:hypothetical protein n=1 Tax=Burkholderia stagnalis TaxID=1503054 RepID=UPI0011CFEABF|nr:hypothetical protein [Burkholderia stagnalis]
MQLIQPDSFDRGKPLVSHDNAYAFLSALLFENPIYVATKSLKFHASVTYLREKALSEGVGTYSLAFVWFPLS